MPRSVSPSQCLDPHDMFLLNVIFNRTVLHLLSWGKNRLLMMLIAISDTTCYSCRESYFIMPTDYVDYLSIKVLLCQTVSTSQFCPCFPPETCSNTSTLDGVKIFYQTVQLASALIQTCTKCGNGREGNDFWQTATPKWFLEMGRKAAEEHGVSESSLE